VPLARQLENYLGEGRRQATNSPVTSAVELKAYQMTIGACFVFRREISRSVFWDFFDSIDPLRILALRHTRQTHALTYPLHPSKVRRIIAKCADEEAAKGKVWVERTSYLCSGSRLI
jgi:hypothetical protein